MKLNWRACRIVDLYDLNSLISDTDGHGKSALQTKIYGNHNLPSKLAYVSRMSLQKFIMSVDLWSSVSTVVPQYTIQTIQ